MDTALEWMFFVTPSLGLLDFCGMDVDAWRWGKMHRLLLAVFVNRDIPLASTMISFSMSATPLIAAPSPA